jgi:hypothetical protein
MNEILYQLHLRVGFLLGEDKTCGNKINYTNEEKAIIAADKMNKKTSTRNILEAYPCPFCMGWHIGRKMALSELESYLNGNY